MTDVAIDRTAPTEAPILDVLQARWSPRAFDPVAIDESILRSALEAARWSPSANNTQPWRYIVGRRGTETFDRIARNLVGFNQEWAPNASALIVAVAERQTADGIDQPWAHYDLGQSVAHLTVQAHADGLVVHQMGGFDKQGVHDAFGLSERFEPCTVIALGTLADADTLPDRLRERELSPRARKSHEELVISG